jgi:hypothetical protein
MKPVVRYLALAVVLAAGVFTSVALAGKPPSPPGQTSNPGSPGDDCSHGNSDKPCKPDPQPGHGSECDDHGNASGNEDHCTATTTAVPNVSSSTSTTTSTEAGGTSNTPTSPAGGIAGTTTGPIGVVTTTTTAAAPTNPATTTTGTAGATFLPPPKTKRHAQPQSSRKLPFTGARPDLLILVGGLLLGSGLLLRRLECSG